MERTIFDRAYFKSHNFRWGLARLIARIFHTSMTTAKTIVHEMRPLTDDECLEKLRGLSKPKTNRGKRRTDIMSKLELELPKDPVYLDIGCNDGSITTQIADAIGASWFWGVDVSIPELPGNFMVYDGVCLPFDDNTFDVITIFQTLHHADNLELIAEIIRVLSPGGYLIIKEHNCTSPELRKLIELEHLLYEIFENKWTIQMCLSKVEWEILFEPLKPVWSYEYDDPTGIYYEAFLKA